MKTTILLCVLGVLCGSTTVRAEGEISSPLLEQYVQGLRTLIVELSTFNGETVFDAYYNGTQKFAGALNEVLSPILSLRPTIKQLVDQQKDVESCVSQTRDTVDRYKKKTQVATTSCSDAYTTSVQGLENKLANVLENLRNVTMQLSNTPYLCQLSNDPSSCENLSVSNAPQLLGSAQTSVQTARTEVTESLNQAYSNASTCLQAPVQTLKAQVETIKTTVLSCLNNL